MPSTPTNTKSHQQSSSNCPVSKVANHANENYNSLRTWSTIFHKSPIAMCDTILNASGCRRAAASFDLLDDFSMEDFSDFLDPVTTASRKRERDTDNLVFNCVFADDDANVTKKQKLEDSVKDLMSVVIEDDDCTFKFLQDCPALMSHSRSNPECFSIEEDDFDIEALLFDDADDAGFCMTPPRSMARETSTSTPPLSPCAEEDLSVLLPFPSSLCEPRSTPVLSMSVLSDDLLDLDSIPMEVLPAITCPSQSLSVDHGNRIPMPSAAWFLGFQSAVIASPQLRTSQVNLPSISSQSVCVEEFSLSTEQKAKHALWFTKRKRCLTGHKGYKCPAKSRAAKNKVRANGRFNLKK